MLVLRVPKPALRPFVKVLWASDDASQGRSEQPARELVLPTGAAHIAFRLSHAPLRLFDERNAARSRAVGHAVLGGPRSAYYVRDVSEPARSVGAQLLPGAAALLTGVPANELAERHTSLNDLWGPAVHRAREALLETASPERALDLLETFLMERLPRVRGLHPVVAHALDRFAALDGVGRVVGECGYSHRRFITLFSDAVGLAPKQYCRVLRLQRTVQRVANEPDVALAELAMSAGFADQPHLCREFRELVGVSPGRYREIRPPQPNHVPLV